jgi:hypothetical protein
VRLLGSPSPLLRAGAAYVLGTAASNNEPFQQSLMQHHPEVVPALMQLINTASSAAGAAAPGAGRGLGGWWARWRGTAARSAEPAPATGSGSSSERGTSEQEGSEEQQQQKEEEQQRRAEEANAGLYALAALLRTNVGARAVFYGAAGMHGLEALLVDPTQPLRVRRKALNLITDLIHQDASVLPAGRAGLDSSATAAAMVQLLGQEPGAGAGGGEQQADQEAEEDLDLQVG